MKQLVRKLQNRYEVYIRILFCTVVFAIITISAFAQDPLRLIAQSTYKADTFAYILTDSLTYRYSGTRGSSIKTGDYLYDSSLRYDLSPKQKYIRTYDANNRVATHIYQAYTLGAWQGIKKFIYAYNASSTQYDSVVSQDWDAALLSWQTTGIATYKYTAARLDTINRFKITGTLREPESRDIGLYTSGNIAEKRFEVWNKISSVWDAYRKEAYTYNSANYPVSYILYTANSTTGILEPVSKQEYTYDGANRVTSHTYYTWFAAGSRWEPVDEYLYTYTAHNDVDIETINTWDFTAQSMQPYKRRTYIYDGSFNVSTITEKLFGTSGFVNSLKEEWLYNNKDLPTIYRLYQWDALGNYWRAYIGNNAQVKYYYEQIPDGITTVFVNTVRLYPNPAINSVHLAVQWKQALPFIITIYSLEGRIVLNTIMPATTAYNGVISLAGIPQGMYLMRLGNGKEEMTEQIIVAGQ